jgi:hypothetical protein
VVTFLFFDYYLLNMANIYGRFYDLNRKNSEQRRGNAEQQRKWFSRHSLSVTLACATSPACDSPFWRAVTVPALMFHEYNFGQRNISSEKTSNLSSKYVYSFSM